MRTKKVADATSGEGVRSNGGWKDWPVSHARTTAAGMTQATNGQRITASLMSQSVTGRVGASRRAALPSLRSKSPTRPTTLTRAKTAECWKVHPAAAALGFLVEHRGKPDHDRQRSHLHRPKSDRGQSRDEVAALFRLALLLTPLRQTVQPVSNRIWL